jgi:hypothetical protein
MRVAHPVALQWRAWTELDGNGVFPRFQIMLDAIEVHEVLLLGVKGSTGRKKASHMLGTKCVSILPSIEANQNPR